MFLKVSYRYFMSISSGIGKPHTTALTEENCGRRVCEEESKRCGITCSRACLKFWLQLTDREKWSQESLT